MNVAVFAYSRRGCKTARRVMECFPEDQVRPFTMTRFEEPGFGAVGRAGEFYGPLFRWAQVLVFVGGVGIAVREIAPFVRSKLTDPAVISVDELGRFVIPLLSGHIGGANALALRLAQAVGGTPVITTATDINGKFSVDAWAARQGLFITDLSAAKAVSAAILERPVPLSSAFPIVTGLPNGVTEGDGGELGIRISVIKEAPFARTLLLVPLAVQLGVGCRRGTSAERIRAAVDGVLQEHQIHPRAVCQVGSIDLKRDEGGLLEFCRGRGLPVRFYTAEELRAAPGEFTPSRRVLEVTGVDNVCERAAMIGAEMLLVRKTIVDGVTVAAAVKAWEVRFE